MHKLQKMKLKIKAWFLYHSVRKLPILRLPGL